MVLFKAGGFAFSTWQEMSSVWMAKWSKLQSNDRYTQHGRYRS